MRRRSRTQTPEQLRANYVVTAKEQFGPVDEVFSVEDRDADGVPVRIYRGVETSEPSRALVYFHGGGYVIGSVDTHDGLTRAFAKRGECVVISVDYRLAPEHQYPGGARRLLDRGEVGAGERGRARDRRRQGRRRRRQRRRDARGDRGAEGARRRHAVRGAAPDLPGDQHADGHPVVLALPERLRPHARRDALVLEAVHRRLGRLRRDRHLAVGAAGSTAPAARDRRHGRGGRAARRGRGLRAAALPRRRARRRATATTG